MSSKIIPGRNVIEVYSGGTQGASAYAVAVKNGYSGTETQWLASLKGAKGDNLKFSDLTSQQIAQITGPQGATGATGATGKAFTMIGKETVAIMNASTASEGDFVVITTGDDRGDLYKKTNNAWVKILNIIGPAGIGEKGDTGDEGIGIAAISQTTESTLDNGINTIQILLSNGTLRSFYIRNGSTGASGQDGYAVLPRIENNVLKWSSDNENATLPADVDIQALASSATSAATVGLVTSPVDVFESNLEEVSYAEDMEV